MNRNVYRLKRRMTPIESALVANIIYIVLVVIFKKITDVITAEGNYNYILGAIEFIVVAAYWIGYNWYIFRQASHKKQGSYAGYIILTMLPILVATVIMTIAIYLMPGTTFGRAWNEFTFLVAPTTFWYMPYGILYMLIGKSIPIVLFMVICFIMVVAFQIIGIAVGSKQRQRMREEAEREELEMQKVSVRKAVSPYKQPVQRKQPVVKRPPKKEKPSINDPFGDDDEHIIYTEAFTPISDEMLEAANQDKRETLENKMAEAVTDKSMTSEIILERVRENVEDDLLADLDLEEVNQSAQKIEKAVEAVVEQETQNAEMSKAALKAEKSILEGPAKINESVKFEKSEKSISFKPEEPIAHSKKSEVKEKVSRETTSTGPQWINPATSNNRKIIEALKSAGEEKRDTVRQRQAEREATQDITMQLEELRKKMALDHKEDGQSK